MCIPVIEVENLFFSYEAHPVLQGVNLKVCKGDFLAIIGPNGGGKSTLIKCILGFLSPERGEIKLFEKPLKQFKEWFKIGYIPQRAGEKIDKLLPLTVEEFLGLGCQIYKKNINKALLKALVEKFGLTSFLKKRIGTLSYGQLQRAYIARALLLEPEVLIMDEPSVGLDFFSQEAFYEILSEYHKKGITIILVTHETWLLSSKITKVACLNQRIFFHETHEEFCKFAETGHFWKGYHKIEHTHW